MLSALRVLFGSIVLIENNISNNNNDFLLLSVEAASFVSSSKRTKGVLGVVHRRQQQQRQKQQQQQQLYSSLRDNDNDNTIDDDSSTTTTTRRIKNSKNTVIASNFWYSVVAKNNQEDTFSSLAVGKSNSGNNNNNNNNTPRNVVPPPCVPTLDKDGPLPASAYVVVCRPGNGNAQQPQQQSNDVEDDDDKVKKTCRMAVALDVPYLRRSCQQEQITPREMVAKLHEYIDAGLSTFHFKTMIRTQQQQQQQEWAEETIFNTLYRETPLSVMKKCQFVIPLRLLFASLPQSSSSSSSSYTPSAIRKRVVSSLMRMGGGDAIDCLQVQYNNNKESSSLYLYDVLDTLNDLKREGLLRSVAGCNIPAHHLQTAKQYGFDIDSNQVDLNLLDPSAYLEQQQQQNILCQNYLDNNNNNMPPLLFASSPLAGGLLTDRYVGRKEQMPFPWQFTLSERQHWNRDVPAWMKRHGYNAVVDDAQEQQQQQQQQQDRAGGGVMQQQQQWQAYQSQILAELEMIALKHRVSVASVALRWTMQLEQVASTIATCRLLYPDDGFKRKDRVQQLRQVFRFELDEEDMKRLWELTGQKQEQEPTHPEQLDEDETLFKEMMEDESGLFVPKGGPDIDFSNKKLWL